MLVAGAVLACGATRGPAPPELGRAEVLREHPLTGRIWDPKAERFVGPEAVAERVARARFVLLGEKHDNPDHHRLQAWILEAIVRSGRRPVVAFEMLDEDADAALEEYLRGSPSDAPGLGAAVGWDERGWPSWEIYLPIAEVALANGLPIVTAGLAKAEVRRISHEGLAALPQALRERMRLDRRLPPEVESRLAEEIRRAHCGMAGEETVRAMIDVQRARDAFMASRLLEVAGEDGAVVIAGAGHVRRYPGVPSDLELHVPREAVLSIAFVEVERGVEVPGSKADAPERSFDLVWYTPRVDEVDPCEKFSHELERLRHRGREGAR